MILEQIQIKSSQVSIKFKFRSKFYFFIRIWLAFSQRAQYKSCPKYSNLPPCKILHFSELPKYPPHLILSYWTFQLENGYKLENSLRAVFLRASLLLQHPGPTQRTKRWPITAPVPQSLTAETHLSGRLPQNPPLLQARVSSPASSPSLSRPHVNSFSPQSYHLCAYTLEPSRLRSCSVASGHHWQHAPTPAPTLAVTAPVGCWYQLLEDEALEQPASLAELPVSKAHRLDWGVASPLRA
jgi:hypothetical protein